MSGSGQFGTNVGGIYYEVDLDTRKVIDGARVVDRELDKAARSFNIITRAIQLYAAALTLVKAAQAADDVRMLGARLEIAAGSAEKGAAALAELQRIAARTQTELAANVSVFSRLNSSILAMGGTQRDTLRITELLTMAIRVSGASAAEASSAMTQFAQALGSGRLQGDELRSLLENAPYLMQQLADGIGVPIGALKQMGEEGKLTADVVTNALAKAAGKIEADFAKVPATLSGAMTQAADAARRANEALDTLTGTSAALTGAVQGTGQVLDMLADQLRGAATESDKLGRNDAVKQWAEGTRWALSFLVDGVDIVRRAFGVTGQYLYGVIASTSAALRGELEASNSYWADTEKRVEAMMSQQLAGARMRQQIEAMATGTDGSDPMDRRARGGAPSNLKPAGGTGDKSKFDALAYLAKLRKETATAYEEIDLIEQEALRKTAQLQAEGKLNAQQAAEARLLIEMKAVQARRELVLNAAEEERQRIERDGKQEIAIEQRLAEERARGRRLAEDTIVGGDPIRQLLLETERRSAVLAEAAARDQEAAALYSEARVALENETQRRITDIVAKNEADRLAAQSQLLTAYGSLFGSLADTVKTFEGEQSSAYRAMFAVSKAFAIADSIIKIQQGVANALSLPYPANIAAAASVAASAAGIVSTIKGTQYGGGRQYGGGTEAGMLYKVNETGRPEMFTAANGSQYMLPNTRGEVTPADKVGGGMSVSIVVQNMAPGVEVTPSVDERTQTVTIAVREVAAQIRARQGPVWSAMSSTTNVKGVR